jgi:hypothetical protein
MTITKLHELILTRLYDHAKAHGYGEEVRLNNLAAEFGETDKSKIYFIACDLERSRLIEANHIMGDTVAFIRPEGERLVREGGTTGIISAFRREPGRFLIDQRDQSTKIYGSVSGSNVSIHSQNVNQAPSELFRGLQQSIQTKITDAAERDQLMARVTELEAETKGTKGFARKYAEFMALAANHVEVFGPFFPALTKLLTGD